ncbi:hypothetical protein FM037_20465 [Shewanella psychropiezotolerans]|uniref:GlyGly-CTERM sorting domain-containing protein n=1 Tax=Shewanella psychropiezotolerans TaxID=2593655 RepID=A0ABX5X5Z1_9GAMM|nr:MULTISPECIES: choice-of-anchor H family protein [Shewanella]MPY21156.1 hypothetical protein [Shewanella sp. YLB-07]MPY21943.1 hypothetical protein [Shewanella sp. YLB-07]QDO86787.1 hypothetical protein FM037_20465 [Shewanella psychropiezotolerans]
MNVNIINQARELNCVKMDTETRVSSGTQSWSCKRISALTLIAGALISFIPNVYASDEQGVSQIESVNLQTFSVGNQAQLVEQDELNTRLSQLKQQMPLMLPSIKAKSREEVIADHKNGNISPKYSMQKSGLKTVNDDAQSTVPKAFSNPIYHEFSIYEASSRLFVDDDGDGFFQTFSVTFDADVYGPDAVEVADVYAELYLSRDGGPWVHYYTTDIFTILGDSSDDDFEVLTTLHNGYYTDHYDVLVDLYEVGFDDIVATISADDTDNFYALPLESSDRDTVYTGGDSSSEDHGGGAFSFISLLGLSLFASLRRRKS